MKSTPVILVAAMLAVLAGPVLADGEPAAELFPGAGHPAANEAPAAAKDAGTSNKEATPRTESADQAATPVRVESPAPPVDVARADELVSQLGADQYAVREAAESQLIAMGRGVLTPLDRTLAATKDAEVLMRLERVYRALTPQETYAGKNPRPGFLGVQMEVHSTDQDPRLKGREWGVKVVSVVADSPAEKAGLRADDLIVKVDREPFLGDVTTGSFVRRVQQIGEGESVEIEFFRGKEQLKVTAVLGGMAKPPEEQNVVAPGQPVNVRQVVVVNGRVVSPTPSSGVTEQDVVSYRWTRWWRTHREAVSGAKKAEAVEAKDAPTSGAAKAPAAVPASDKPKEKP
jgi:hypothetical protein